MRHPSIHALPSPLTAGRLQMPLQFSQRGVIGSDAQVPCWCRCASFWHRRSTSSLLCIHAKMRSPHVCTSGDDCIGNSLYLGAINATRLAGVGVAKGRQEVD